MDYDWGVVVGLNGTHLDQHFQDGRDGVWYPMIGPGDIVKLFQGSTNLGGGGT